MNSSQAIGDRPEQSGLAAALGRAERGVELVAWFRGEVADCFEVLLPYERELLPSHWRAWKREHPQAIPRSGFEWLDDPADPRHSSAAEVRTARRMLLRDLVR